MINMNELPLADFKYSGVANIVRNRLRSNRDVKILIAQRDSGTGLGKTTLAVLLAKYFDRNGWTSKKGFLDVRRYLTYYAKASDAGDVLLFDDAEAGVDNRRSMSETNVYLSKYWSILRVYNVVSILTFPTSSMIDKRVLELADIYMIVRERGIAAPYRVKIGDMNQKIFTPRIKIPNTDAKELIRYRKFDDEDYHEMTRKKKKFVAEEIENDFDEDLEDLLPS